MTYVGMVFVGVVLFVVLGVILGVLWGPGVTDDGTTLDYFNYRNQRRRFYSVYYGGTVVIAAILMAGTFMLTSNLIGAAALAIIVAGLGKFALAPM